MSNGKNYYDYCEIMENQGSFLVKFGYQSYNGQNVNPPILIGDRIFPNEKKALRYAKKITASNSVRLEKSK